MEREEPGYWVVTHRALCCGEMTLTATVVKAFTKEEALTKFNALAAQRKGSPHYWPQVYENDVTPLMVIP